MTEKDLGKFGEFVINLSKFLSRYYNINSENSKKLSHEAFKEVFNLDSTPIYDIFVTDIIRGEKILVCDVDGIIRGYDNSYVNEKESEIIMNENDTSYADLEFKQMYEYFDVNGKKLTELSDYELDRLLDLSKKTRDDRTKNKVIKELKFRPESKPGSKQKKLEKVRKREFDNQKMKGDLL